MKKIYFLLISLFCLHAQAQFMHLPSNKESGPAAITLLDGKVLYGKVKNNKVDNFFLRGLGRASDRNAMSNANLTAERIAFKEDSTTKFVDMDPNLIYKINFFDEAGVSALEVFRLKIVTIDLDTKAHKKSFSMFLTQLLDGDFKTYGYTIYQDANYMYTDSYVGVIGEDYAVSVMHNGGLPTEGKVFKALKYVGKNCKAYQDYMEEMNEEGDLKSRSEFKAALKEFKATKKDVIAQAKLKDNLSKREAKEVYKVKKDLLYMEFLNQKYQQLCK